jgi:hypothetical protein
VGLCGKKGLGDFLFFVGVFLGGVFLGDGTRTRLLLLFTRGLLRRSLPDLYTLFLKENSLPASSDLVIPTAFFFFFLGRFFLVGFVIPTYCYSILGNINFILFFQVTPVY